MNKSTPSVMFAPPRYCLTDSNLRIDQARSPVNAPQSFVGQQQFSGDSSYSLSAYLSGSVPFVFFCATEVHLQSSEAHLQSSEVHLQSSEAHLQSSEAHLKSSEVHLKSSEVHFQSSEVRFQSSEVRFQSSEARFRGGVLHKYIYDLQIFIILTKNLKTMLNDYLKLNDEHSVNLPANVYNTCATHAPAWNIPSITHSASRTARLLRTSLFRTNFIML